MNAEPLNIADALAAPHAPAVNARPGVKITKAGETPGSYVWDGETGTVCTPVLDKRPDTWDAYLRVAGIDPETVTVDEPVQVRGWQQTVGDEWLHYFALKVRLRVPGRRVDDIIKSIGRRRLRKRPAPAGESTFIVQLGDLQLGKVDGDGYEGTFDRAKDRIEQAAERLALLRRITDIGPVHLAWMGDGCEGFVSQGGANIWRTVLPITEQMRLLRRLMMYGIDVFLPTTDELSVSCVSGNHDQALRPNGSGSMTGSDSFDVESMVSIADSLKINPDGYGHVSIYTPQRDELTVTLETSGTIVGLAHGHMWRTGKHFDWWKGQRFGRFDIGEADLLLAAHLHHLLVEDNGPQRFVQSPSLESESTWYRQRTGTAGAPGIVTMTVRDRKASYIDVI